MMPCLGTNTYRRNARVEIARLVVAVVILFQRCLAADPQPISVATTTDFFGYDGQWSAVTIRVGTPEQWLSAFPSTLSQETWVIGPDGCDGTDICQQKRGGLFFANESSSFVSRGFYELGFDTQLGGTGDGDYGLDTLALDDAVSAPDQIVAIINSTEYWLGQFGLGVQQTRFNGTQDYLPFLSSLVQNESLIPSHSYGYTAGAYYRLKTVPASLTLGGVDANRYTPNNMTFTLGPGYAPVLAINSISVSSADSDELSMPGNWNTNPSSLLNASQADLFTIDSSTPFLWLPEPVCDALATALNLTYNETLQLYVFSNDTSPELLTSWNLTFTFSLSNLPGSSDNIELTIPYDAFNLQLSYPFPHLDANFSSPPTNYFPVRRAANTTQYTIGRAFLQETYLTVDYERNSFYLSQAVFSPEALGNVNLLAITRPADSTWPGSVTASRHDGLSTGAKAGVGVGAAAGAVVAVLCLLLFYVRRRRALNGGDDGSKSAQEKSIRRRFFGRLHRLPGLGPSVSELLGDKRQPTEVPAGASHTRFELSGSTPVEMPAEDVSPTFLASRDSRGQRASATIRNDPRRPVELAHRGSMTKEDSGEVSERSSSPVPPYSPAEINPRFSSSISPYSTRYSPGLGTGSSGEQGISPVGPGSGGDSHRSSGNSRSLSSPISPEIQSPRPYGGRRPNERQMSGGVDAAALLVPESHGRTPSRSLSRSSRFVEEGLSDVVEEQHMTESSRSPPTQSGRFSWEE